MEVPGHSSCSSYGNVWHSYKLRTIDCQVHKEMMMLGGVVPCQCEENRHYICPERDSALSSLAPEQLGLSLLRSGQEAQSCIRSRYMSDLEKAMFLYDHRGRSPKRGQI